MKNRRYSKEVKLTALRELQSGKPMAEICREHVTDATTVRRWKREYDKNPENAFSGKGIASTAEARLSHFERLVGQLYAENYVLKKALEKLEKLRAEQQLARSFK